MPSEAPDALWNGNFHIVCATPGIAERTPDGNDMKASCAILPWRGLFPPGIQREGRMGETIRRLRLKTTALVTLMVGVVLVAVLAVEYLNAYNLQSRLVSSSLHGRISEGDNPFQMGRPDSMPAREPPSRHSSILMSLLIELSEDGTVLSADGNSIEISTEGLSVVVDRIMTGETEGIDEATNLAWLSKASPSGGTLVAVVDVSSSRDAMVRQAYTEIVVLVVSIAIVSVMAWIFSGFAVRPIADAWDRQQRFIADASHELKTPLAVIKANMSVVGREGSLSEDTRRWIASTVSEADRMNSLITDMLELARTEDMEGLPDGGGKSETEPLNLSQLVEETSMELDAMAFERGHEIVGDIAPEAWVSGSGERLGRVVRILIDNATKYGSEGSPVLVTLTTSRRHARLSVHNEGTPIAQEDLAHVFERFYKSDKARTADEGKSFGLGLPIAKNIVKAHNGRLEVTSDEGGTTFVMTLRLSHNRKSRN